MLKQKKSPIRLNFVSCKKKKKEFFQLCGGGGGVTLLSLNPNSINSCFFMVCFATILYMGDSVWTT